MDKDTKILLMAVVIILVALVSFNLSDLTGKVTSSSSITVSSPTGTTITFGKYDSMKIVSLNINVGSEAVRNQVDLYRESGARVGQTFKIDKSMSVGSMISNKRVSTTYSIGSDLDANNLIRYYFGAKNKAGDVVLTSDKITIT